MYTLGSWSAGNRASGAPLGVRDFDMNESAVGAARAASRVAAFADWNAFTAVGEVAGPAEIVAVKDIIDVRGFVTTGGADFLPRQIADVDAEVVANARAHGCQFIGKTNLSPFAIGPTSVNDAFGAVRNPVDKDRIAGGSSGGSAAAVALGMCDWAIGTDTGGSVRTPASLCGVVGHKPTLGLLSTQGVMPLSHTLDTVGVLAPNVRWAARALAVMGGRGEHEVGTWPHESGPRLAYPRDWVSDLDDETAEAWQSVCRDLPAVDFPARADIDKVHVTIARAEMAAYHSAWLRSHGTAYAQDVRAHIAEGQAVSAVDYLVALGKQQAATDAVEDAMSGWDAVVLPTTGCVAPPLKDSARAHGRWDPLARFTRPFNVTGHPVVSLPFPSRGLPVGIQVVGHHGADRHLLRVAEYLENKWS